MTGSCAWTRYVFQNFFFGVKGVFEGLLIDPHLPANKDFKNCKLFIKFRNASYDISFSNPKLKKNSAVKEISVDGKKIEGKIISPFEKGIHKVNVILG